MAPDRRVQVGRSERRRGRVHRPRVGPQDRQDQAKNKSDYTDDESKELADGFVAPLRKLEEEEDPEALVEIHTDDCEVGNVAVPQTFRGHEGLREFWRSYRSTFGEMRSEFRNVYATEEGAALE